MSSLIKATLLLGVLALWPAQTSFGQNKSESALLGRSIGCFEIKKANVHVALSTLSASFGIPIGVEVAKGGNTGPEIQLSIRNGTLRQVLNAVMEQDGRYEWRLNDGVINVMPKSDHDPLLQTLLDTRIRTFSTKEKTDTFFLRLAIVDLPEVKATLSEAGVRPRISAYTNADIAGLGTRFTLTMSDTTLRNLLNEIVRKETSEAKYWVVNRFRDGGEYFILNFAVFERPAWIDCPPVLAPGNASVSR